MTGRCSRWTQPHGRRETEQMRVRGRARSASELTTRKTRPMPTACLACRSMARTTSSLPQRTGFAASRRTVPIQRASYGWTVRRLTRTWYGTLAGTVSACSSVGPMTSTLMRGEAGCEDRVTSAASSSMAATGRLSLRRGRTALTGTPTSRMSSIIGSMWWSRTEDPPMRPTRSLPWTRTGQTNRP